MKSSLFMLYCPRVSASKPTLSKALLVISSPYAAITALASRPSLAASITLTVLTTLLNVSAVSFAASAAFASSLPALAPFAALAAVSAALTNSFP